MKDGKDSKEYDEILKIAEGVINKKKVTKATGKVGCENQVNTVVGKSRNATPGYVRNKRTNPKAVHSSPIGANWNCFYCKTDEHPGGWRSCPLLGNYTQTGSRGQTSGFSIDPHSFTRSLKSGGVSTPNNVVSGRRRPPLRTTKKKEQLRGVKEGKTSKDTKQFRDETLVGNLC